MSLCQSRGFVPASFASTHRGRLFAMSPFWVAGAALDHDGGD